MDFKPFEKIPRLSRDCVITEKIDGTNACIYIGDFDKDGPDNMFLTGSRTRWITPTDDNYGFSKWAHANRDELEKLGPGLHFGEWWGQGIQRKYDLKEKRFSLFNSNRWADPAIRPSCCHVVPVLYSGPFSTDVVNQVLTDLIRIGSMAAPGFMKPEGIIIWHEAARVNFKKTIEKDESPKGKANE